MTILYRTPTQIIDQHEWCAQVVKHYGKVLLVYRFRPLSHKPMMWQSISQWKGPKPKGMCDVFWRFRGHIREAMASERARRDALAGLGARQPTGAQTRNPGRYALTLAS